MRDRLASETEEQRMRDRLASETEEQRMRDRLASETEGESSQATADECQPTSQVGC